MVHPTMRDTKFDGVGLLLRLLPCMDLHSEQPTVVQVALIPRTAGNGSRADTTPFVCLENCVLTVLLNDKELKHGNRSVAG